MPGVLENGRRFPGTLFSTLIRTLECRLCCVLLSYGLQKTLPFLTYPPEGSRKPHEPGRGFTADGRKAAAERVAQTAAPAAEVPCAFPGLLRLRVLATLWRPLVIGAAVNLLRADVSYTAGWRRWALKQQSPWANPLSPLPSHRVGGVGASPITAGPALGRCIEIDGGASHVVLGETLVRNGLLA